MGRLESDVMKSVKRRLETWAMTGEVIWWLRINCGKIKDPYSPAWIQLAPKGTPDFIAIIRSKKDGIRAVFIECKRSDGTGILSPDQKKFKNKYESIDYIDVLQIDDPKQLDNFIEAWAIDTVSLIDTGNL